MSKPHIIGLSPKAPTLTPEQEDIVKALEDALELAKEGRIHTVGIICCMDKGPAFGMAGTAASHLNLGLDLMKAEIMRRAE
jgi:hypothetical protein